MPGHSSIASESNTFRLVCEPLLIVRSTAGGRPTYIASKAPRIQSPLGCSASRSPTYTLNAYSGRPVSYLQRTSSGIPVIWIRNVATVSSSIQLLASLATDCRLPESKLLVQAGKRYDMLFSILSSAS